MKNKALVVIDLQNDITKNYQEIIGTTNQAIDWAVANNMYVVYIQHNNLSAGTRTFKPDTHGAEFVPELKIVSQHIFLKTKSNAEELHSRHRSIILTLREDRRFRLLYHISVYQLLLHTKTIWFQ